MNGKIYPGSTNIHQDQAKILFDFYQSAAERIVQEEERIEKEIDILTAEVTKLSEEMSSVIFWKWLLCIFIFPYFINAKREKELKMQIVSHHDRIAEYRKMHDEIFRDYTIEKMGIVYVPVAEQFSYEQNSFIVDYTGAVGETEVTLQLSKQNDLLIESVQRLEQLSTEAPIVESSNEIEEIDTEHYSTSLQSINQHDYFGGLERTLRTISYCIQDLDTTIVKLPLISEKDQYYRTLKEYTTTDIDADATIVSLHDSSRYTPQIEKFRELQGLRDSLSRQTEQFEDVLKDLMITMSQSVQSITSLKLASTDKIVFESNKTLFKILKSGYNHYSPILEGSEIERIRQENFNYSELVSDYVPFQLRESSKVKYNPISGNWTAEDGSVTTFPFSVHQIHDEIVAPMVQNLMNETRIERLKIYNHIKDQKLSYLNKWHQDTEDFYGRNRAESADLINLMRASLRDYIASYNTLASLKNTEQSMIDSGGSLDSTIVSAVDNSAEVFAAFDLQSKEFQKVQLEFEEYMERLKQDIEEKAKHFEHIEYYDALLRDGKPKEIAVADSEIHSFDPRRKPLVSINAHFAKTSELPPEPSIEAIVHEHMSLNLPIIAKNTLHNLGNEDDILQENISQNENVKAYSVSAVRNPRNPVQPSNQDTSNNQDAELKQDEIVTSTEQKSTDTTHESDSYAVTNNQDSKQDIDTQLKNEDMDHEDIGDEDLDDEDIEGEDIGDEDIDEEEEE